MLISFGETGGFTKFYLFLSKKRGGVNTCGGAIFPRDRSLTAAGAAVYDHRRSWPGGPGGSHLQKGHRHLGPQFIATPGATNHALTARRGPLI